MEPRYATFIWVSYGLAAATVLWNVLAPLLARKQVVQKLRQRNDEQPESDEDAAG